MTALERIIVDMIECCDKQCKYCNYAILCTNYGNGLSKRSPEQIIQELTEEENE